MYVSLQLARMSIVKCAARYIPNKSAPYCMVDTQSKPSLVEARKKYVFATLSDVAVERIFFAHFVTWAEQTRPTSKKCDQCYRFHHTSTMYIIHRANTDKRTHRSLRSIYTKRSWRKEPHAARFMKYAQRAFNLVCAACGYVM